MDWTIFLLGFLVGLRVGLTSIGGAALMTPLLFLAAGVMPVIAAGTDLAYSGVIRIVDAFLQGRQRTVDPFIASYLAVGFAPGTLAGVAVIHSP